MARVLELSAPLLEHVQTKAVMLYGNSKHLLTLSILQLTISAVGAYCE